MEEYDLEQIGIKDFFTFVPLLCRTAHFWVTELSGLGILYLW
jgi:hypothetical protein